MTDEQQLAEAFWQMNRAVLRINEILSRNPALAEYLPITPPKITALLRGALARGLLRRVTPPAGTRPSLLTFVPGTRLISTL